MSPARVRSQRPAPDTSVIIAAFASWHERHDLARNALERGATLIGRCALETYSVLTRLPAPHRADHAVVAEFLGARFGDESVGLPDAQHGGALVRRLSELGISGGAVYDALIAATAAHHGLTLLTLDGRAEATYARLGARYRLLA